MIGSATVVALSEGVHAGAEPLEFRNRLFQDLVLRHGFTAIAIESGITEGRVVHDYVLDGKGDLEKVLANGLTWTFDHLPQNEALVRWIRAYNQDPAHGRKLDFYGFDVPGSPGNPMANRAPRTALDEVLGYLGRVDSAAAGRWHRLLDPLLPNVRLDPRPVGDSAQYSRLAQPERDAITAAIADLAALIERQEARYIAASSPAEYRWAVRNVIGARQVDTWLRHVPIGWQPSQGMTFFGPATDVRDRGQADNLAWIVEQEGAGGKVLVFASRYHVSTAPVRTVMGGGVANQVMGTYLRRRVGNRLVTIGNLIAKGAYGCAGFSAPLDPTTPRSLEGLLSTLGTPSFVLDLRPAPPTVRSWLDQEHQLGDGSGAFQLEVGKAFDLLFYLDQVNPACPK
jgi:erythromycin esterase